MIIWICDCVQFSLSKEVYINGEEEGLHYDVLVVNVGSAPKFPDDFSVREVAITTRPIRVLESKIYEFEKKFPPNDWKTLIPKVAVVGGGLNLFVDLKPFFIFLFLGAAGVELAFAIKARYSKKYRDVDVTIVDRNKYLMKEHGEHVGRSVKRILEKHNVCVILNAQADRVEEIQELEKVDERGKEKPSLRLLVLSNQQKLEFHILIWAGGPSPPPLLQNSGLELCQHGWIKVLPTLQSVTSPNVFACGDCCTVVGFEWLSKSGVTSVSQGPILSENLERYLSGNRNNLLSYPVHQATHPIQLISDFRI